MFDFVRLGMPLGLCDVILFVELYGQNIRKPTSSLRHLTGITVPNFVLYSTTSFHVGYVPAGLHFLIMLTELWANPYKIHVHAGINLQYLKAIIHVDQTPKTHLRHSNRTSIMI